MRPRGRTVDAPSPREARARWIRALETAQAHAEAVLADQPIERFAAADFARDVLQARKAPFPLRHVSAGAASSAFLTAAQALIAADRPTKRRVLAEITAAAARGVDQLLNEDRTAQAQAWKRQMPED